MRTASRAPSDPQFTAPPIHTQTTPSLDMRIVSLGSQRLNVLDLNRVRLAGALGQSLQLDGLALLLGLSSPLSVGLDAVDEFFSGARVVDVLDTDVDALLHVAVADLLVEDDADGRLGHVVDDARLAVVDFVHHTLLHGAVVLDVHDVADTVGFPVRLLSVLSVSRSHAPFCFASNVVCVGCWERPYMYVPSAIMPFWRCLRLKA
jgi:hypothetical protein